MLNKEEIEKVKRGLTEELNRTIKANECGLSTNDFSESIEILENALKYIDQLETNNKKLIETNDKYLQKLVYALTPTQHALGDDYNNAFKKIIADNIDLETCKIRRKLKEFWGIDKY